MLPSDSLAAQLPLVALTAAAPVWSLGPWAREHLPPTLLATGPWGISVWQWLLIALLLLVAFPLSRLLGSLLVKLLGRVAARTYGRWDDLIIANLEGPVVLGWLLVLLRVSLPILGFTEVASERVRPVIAVGVLVLFFWTLLRLADVTSTLLAEQPWAQRRPSARSLLPLARRIVKALVIAMGVVTILSELGYPVASLIAGLGIGGVAVALAGQKTVENLFGAFTIGVDQPFRHGDYVKVEDQVAGTIESVGLRSTRIRTADRSVVTIPNGKLAEMRLETFAPRDRYHLPLQVKLTYGTTAEQLREVLAGIEGVLRSRPSLWPDDVVVRFSALGASSLDLEVLAWFVEPDFGAFRNTRQEVLLGIMDVVEKAGARFAFPTQTLHVVQDR
jgi:MscS family membrane protein